MPRKPRKIIAIGKNPICGLAKTCAVGFKAMKAMAIPAKVPSRAARGVIFRINSPQNEPMTSITPFIKHAATPTR